MGILRMLIKRPGTHSVTLERSKKTKSNLAKRIWRGWEWARGNDIKRWDFGEGQVDLVAGGRGPRGSSRPPDRLTKYWPTPLAGCATPTVVIHARKYLRRLTKPTLVSFVLGRMATAQVAGPSRDRFVGCINVHHPAKLMPAFRQSLSPPPKDWLKVWESCPDILLSLGPQLRLKAVSVCVFPRGHIYFTSDAITNQHKMLTFYFYHFYSAYKEGESHWKSPFKWTRKRTLDNNSE